MSFEISFWAVLKLISRFSRPILPVSVAVLSPVAAQVSYALVTRVHPADTTDATASSPLEDDATPDFQQAINSRALKESTIRFLLWLFILYSHSQLVMRKV